jgi:hypothetical protein
LILVLAFSWIYFRHSGHMCSVGGDVPVDYEGVSDDFVNLKMMCRLNFSEVLIGVGCACFQRGECMCVCMMMCVYTVFKKEIFLLYGDTPYQATLQIYPTIQKFLLATFFFTEFSIHWNTR